MSKYDYEYLKRLSYSSGTRGRYKLHQYQKSIIENALNGAGSIVECADIKNAVYEKSRIRELIRDNYPSKSAFLVTSLIGNLVVIWDSRIHGRKTITKSIFEKIIENSSNIFMSPRAQNLKALKDLERFAMESE